MEQVPLLVASDLDDEALLLTKPASWPAGRPAIHPSSGVNRGQEGSLRGEITQRTRTARDKSQENTAPHFWGDIP